MTKARDLADLIAAGSGLADGTVEVADISDLTATAAELNILDGATVSTTELNYVSGVTSAVQTQLDGKASTASIPTDFVSAASGGTFSGAVTVSGEFVATSYNEGYVAVTSTTNATTVNCEAGNTFMHTLTEATTFTFSNPPASGTAYIMSIEIIQDASGSGYSVTWPTSVDWAGGTAPTLTSAANGVDVFAFSTRDGGTTWYGFTAGLDLK